VIDAIQHSDKKLVLVALAGSPLINFAREQELALFLKRLLIVLIIVMVN
jgi:lactam utilization protein B